MIQQAAVTDTSIAGLPAEVVADLARNALNGAPDTSEAALAALTTLAEESATQGGGRDPMGIFAAAFDGLSAAWSWIEAAATYAMESPLTGPALLALLLFVGTVLHVRARARRDAYERSHGSSPHRRAYAQAVTTAAQLLSTGADTASVAKASGLARDVVDVVRSRRLIPAAPSGTCAGAERSPGRNGRGRRATAYDKVLK